MQIVSCHVACSAKPLWLMAELVSCVLSDERGTQRMPTVNWIGKDVVEGHHKEIPYRLVHCDGAW